MVNTSKMGDLDINLITLYARTPALYDKRNPLYKDKVYAERAWNDIATRLGYKVEILKDRMLQLRNRYNLEKRKIESMRNETCQNPKSSWVLFRYLSFFDGHIKQRRSYKMLRKIQDANDGSVKSRGGVEKPQRRRSLNAIPTSSSNNNSNDSTDFHNDLQAMSNLMRNHDEIKSEDDSDDVSLVEAIPILNENSSDSQIFDFNNGNNNGKNSNVNDSNFHRMSSSPLNNDNNSCGPPPMTVIAQHPYAATTTSSSFDNFANLDKKFNKYNAFGQFIAASLADLTDDKATDVMQRITMEIFAAQRDLN